MLPITVMMTRFPPSLKTLIVVSSLLLFRTECHAAQSDEKAQNLLRREGKNPLLIQHSVPSGAVLLAASAGNYSKKNGDSDEGNPSDIDEESCSAVETHENAEQNNSVAFLLEQSIEGEESDQNERMIMIPACPGQSNIDEPPPSTMFFSSSIGKTAKKFGWLILPLAAVIAILSSSTSDISTTRSSTLFPLKKNPSMSATSGRDQLHANIGAKYDEGIGQHQRKMDGLFPSDLEAALGEGNSIFHKKKSEQDFGRIGNGDESRQHQMTFLTNTLQPVNYAQADVKGVETKFLDFGNVGEKEKRYPSGGKDIAVGQQSKNLIEAGSASVDAKKIINVPGTAGSIFVPAAALPTSSSTVSTTIPSAIKHSMIGSENESVASSYDSTTNEHTVTQHGQENKVHDKANKMASVDLNALEDKYTQYTNRQYERWNGGNCYHCTVIVHIDQQNNVKSGGSVGKIVDNSNEYHKHHDHHSSVAEAWAHLFDQAENGNNRAEQDRAFQNAKESVQNAMAGTGYH